MHPAEFLEDEYQSGLCSSAQKQISQKQDGVIRIKLFINNRWTSSFMLYLILINLHSQISTSYWLKAIKDKLIPTQTVPELETNKRQTLPFSAPSCKDQKSCNQEWAKILLFLGGKIKAEKLQSYNLLLIHFVLDPAWNSHRIPICLLCLLGEQITTGSCYLQNCSFHNSMDRKQSEK